MTNEEAIIAFKNECYETCKREDGNCCECLDVAYKMAIRALEKADKYKRHDLRKNPEDLPRNEAMYFIYYQIEDGEKVFYAIELFEPIKGFCCPSNVKVIAWREIEPLEEEEA